MKPSQKTAEDYSKPQEEATKSIRQDYLKSMAENPTGKRQSQQSSHQSLEQDSRSSVLIDPRRGNDETSNLEKFKKNETSSHHSKKKSDEFSLGGFEKMLPAQEKPISENANQSDNQSLRQERIDENTIPQQVHLEGKMTESRYEPPSEESKNVPSTEENKEQSLRKDENDHDEEKTQSEPSTTKIKSDEPQDEDHESSSEAEAEEVGYYFFISLFN